MGPAAAFFGNGTINLTQLRAISGNTATGDGGGVEVFVATSNLSNCTISGNTAGRNGGGALSYGTMNLSDCTVSSNSAANYGGGIGNLGPMTLIGTIVAGNTSTKTPAGPSDISGNTVSGTFNLVGKDNTGGLKNGVGGNIVGVANAGLGSLGNYGGPTQTTALLTGSPAIGKGVAVSATTTDQRGLARGAVVDIGAFQTSLVVESTGGSINKTPAQLTLPGAVSLAKDFAGPIAISFDPAVFTGGQTIALTDGQLELSRIGTVPSLTIKGPANGVTVDGGGANPCVPDQRVCHGQSALGFDHHRWWGNGRPRWRHSQPGQRDSDQLHNQR